MTLKHTGLDAGEYAYYILLPNDGPFACLGLVEKYTGFLAVETQKNEENITSFKITETGNVVWLTEKKIKKVTINGKDLTDKVQKNGFVYELVLEDSDEKMMLEIEYPTTV